jgi:Lipopolysaccharide-assembly
MNRLAIIVATAALAGVISGCGYRQANKYGDKPQGKYEWHSLYREDIRTVAVPTFTNKSFTRGTEFQLTKSVVNYIESTTPYKVVDRTDADTILEGEITSIQGSMISADRHTALPQEEMITINVNFVWKDLRSGRILKQKTGFGQSSMYYPTLGEASYVGMQNGVEKLALGIVQEMQADW